MMGKNVKRRLIIVAVTMATVFGTYALRDFGSPEVSALATYALCMIFALMAALTAIMLMQMFSRGVSGKRRLILASSALSVIVAIAFNGLIVVWLTTRSVVEQYLLPEIPWVCFLILAFVVFVRLTKRSVQRMWDENPMLQGAKVADISVDGVEIRDHLYHTNYSWQIFSSARETKNLFVLFMSPLVFVMIPKRAIESEEQLSAMRAMLRNLLTGNRPTGFAVVPTAPEAAVG